MAMSTQRPNGANVRRFFTQVALQTFHLLKPPGKKKTKQSSSDRFLLKPTGERKKILKQMEETRFAGVLMVVHFRRLRRDCSAEEAAKLLPQPGTPLTSLASRPKWVPYTSPPYPSQHIQFIRLFWAVLHLSDCPSI